MTSLDYRKILILSTITFSTLSLELLITKILSYVFWNHIVYLIISIALLGYGISSSFIIIFHRKRANVSEHRFIFINIIAYVVSVFTALILLKYLDITPGRLVHQAIPLLTAYLLFVLPFFFSGNVIIFLFFLYPKYSNRLYFWDLFGAALGCLAFPLLITKVGAIHGILICACITLIATIPLSKFHAVHSLTDRILLAILLLLTLFTAALLPLGNRVITLHPDPTKSLGCALDRTTNPSSTREYMAWDVVSRVDIVSNHDSPLNIGWTRINPRRKLITFDGDAISQIDTLSEGFPTKDNIEQFRKSDLHVPFFENLPNRNHLIIGLGGGPDIARSLLLQAKNITGVEINAAIIKAMKGHFSNFSGQIFNRPNVKTYHAEGRSFLRREKHRFDLIQMTGVDTFTALNTGAYVLAENYLYTVEAIRDYYSHLSDEGILCIHRWFFDQKPRESLRLFATALEALRQEKVSHPEHHIAVVRAGSGITFVRKKPFTKNEVLSIKHKLLGRNGNPRIIYMPWLESNLEAAKDYMGLLAAFRNNTLDSFYDQYEYDVRPVNDDKPFFFKYYKSTQLWRIPLRSLFSSGPIRGYWAYLVFITVLISAFFAVSLFIFLPLFLFRRDGIKIKGSLFFSLYFLSLGLGFIFIEITLMQKFALFLGHPMYSVSTVLGGMLLFAGLGSAASDKWGNNPIRLLTLAIAILLIMISSFPFLSNLVTEQLFGYDLVYRVPVVLILIAPIAFPLGFFFPTGLKIVEKRASEFVPWAWGINSGFTVIGSVLAILLAMVIGFTQVLLLSLAIYVLGTAAMCVYNRHLIGVE